jgi:uncharacterized phage-associated protein
MTATQMISPDHSTTTGRGGTVERMFDEVRSALPAREAEYSFVMTVSARDVATVLRDRLPDLATKKLHKLLYYCQGHHLATFGVPLFSETISAWDMGPMVGSLWSQERRGEPAGTPVALGEAELNTIGYVLSRYGALTGRDLENLTHGESPWQMADRHRRPGESARIETQWITEFFTASGIADREEDDVLLDSDTVTRWLAGAEVRRADALQPDSMDELRSRLHAGA